MPWNPGDDVIEVVRGPEPGGAGGAYRAFGETLRGLKTTFARVVEGPTTIQYPEEKVAGLPALPRAPPAAPLRGHRAWRSASAARCAPPPARPTASASSPPRTRPRTASRAGERYAAVYEINLSRCIFCGYCEVACPFDAITMGHDYELSDYNRSDLIFTKEMLLAEPLERTPLRAEGE